MTDVYEAIKEYNDLRDTGKNVEYHFGKETTIGLEGGDQTRYDSVGDAFVGIVSTVGGMVSGATSATLGLPSDIGGLFVGIKDAVSAEDGQRIDAFVNGFSEFSKANLGSEYYRGIFDNFVDGLDVDPKLKEDAKSGFTAGEFGGVGGAVAKGPKVIKKGLEKVGDKAQRELDLDGGGTALSSMGAGQMNTALNTHLAKLAKNREQATRKVDDLGFYSKALEEANKIKQEKGTGQQFKSMLLKAGVKQDEIDWSGLDEVLSKDKITKQEIIDQLEANRIELEEVEKVGSFEEGYFDLTNSFDGERLDDEALKRGVIPDKMKATFTAEEAYGDDYLINRASELKDDDPSLSDELAMQQAKDEYYDDPIRFYIDEKTGYTITGNSEVGYSIFKSKDESFNFQNRLKTLNQDEPIYSINEAEIQAEQLARDSGDIQGPLDELDAGKYEDYTLPGGDNYRELLLTFDQNLSSDSRLFNKMGNDYFGPHYDEGNIISHIRTKDRMYGNKKVLFIEEIQSDWGQQGRKQGFKKSEEEMKAISSQRKQAQALVDKYEKQIKETGKDLVGKELDEANQASNYLQETQNFVVANDRKVPKAPFVTDTNKWTALAMKRIISKASEEGYDAIAITPGKVHTDRWNTPGLANFYDNVVPKIAKQVVGKLGGNVKKLPTSKDTDLRDTPSGDEYFNMEAFDGALFIELTPQAKDKALKGQALFAVPVGATAVGTAQQKDQGDANES